MRRYSILILLLLLSYATPTPALDKRERSLAGIIYFTNNTPRNLGTFPVELYTRNGRKRLAASTPDSKGRFRLDGVKPGKYLLKFSWPPDYCVLVYRVDVRKESKTSIQVIMDAACGSGSGGGAARDLPES